MKSAIIYCRVSTEEQTKNLSLPAQERRAREYCERERLKVERVFVEEGKSAKTANRPELRAALDFLKSRRGTIHYLVVLNTSRFTRNADDHSLLGLQLKSCGVELRSVEEPQIDNTPIGIFMSRQAAAFAELDNGMKAQR